MAKRSTVPKFGTWDKDNVGYTAYFDRVRENKGATAPPLHRPFNPNDPEEGPMMSVPPPSSSRPATSGGRREPQQRHHHRRADSGGSAAADPGGRGSEQSKFAPPPQYYQQRPSPEPAQQYYQQRPSPEPAQQYHGGHHHHHGGHQQQHQPQAAHGAGGGHRMRTSHAQRHHHHAGPAARARSASPQSNAPSRQRASAVPKFGVWDEQTAAAAAQGFTVQFENVKRHREVARTAVPSVPRAPSPPEGGAARHSHHHNHKPPFVSKVRDNASHPVTTGRLVRRSIADQLCTFLSLRADVRMLPSPGQTLTAMAAGVSSDFSFP
ncbi:RPM1-interacting protein 4-like [Panicum miliaceum]|uniref:RPM1-interacting protein 4-like n=1 Tax=Panicum miliaceum TaxID=4540 RepID=A0A3L6S103_PANMI|nr:RPM1-interacting protein 4-like [Panicum miliaceum]